MLAWAASIILFLWLAVKLIMMLAELISIRKSLRQFWPAMESHWFWGHIEIIRHVAKHPETLGEFMKKNLKKFPYGSVIYVGPILHFLRVYHHSVMRNILSGSDKDFPKSDTTYKALVPWLGKGLLILKGKDWHRHRRLLTNSFHREILRPYARKMNDCSGVLMEKWQKKTVEKSCSIELFHEFSLLTIDALMQCLFGYETNCQIEHLEHQGYVTAIYKLSGLVSQRLRSQNIFMRVDKIYYLTKDGREFTNLCKKTRFYANKVIEKRRKEYESGFTVTEDAKYDKNSQRNYDFLDVLLQAKDSHGNHLSDEEINDEVNTFMFEGHDTTTSALAWTCFCLATNPKHQELCYEEIMEVMDDRESVQWDDLPKLQYLTLCIKEVLRIYPPVATINRKPAVDTVADGKVIKKGTEVLLSLIGLHHNPAEWDNADEFDPLRFSPERNKNRDPYAYAPFSAGVRNCIGQNFALNEIKICMAHVLRNFKLALDESKPVVPLIELIYRTKNGLHLIVTPRQR